MKQRSASNGVIPVVYIDAKAHAQRPLGSGEKLPGKYLAISEDNGNTIGLGSDGGLYGEAPSGADLADVGGRVVQVIYTGTTDNTNTDSDNESFGQLIVPNTVTTFPTSWKGRSVLVTFAAKAARGGLQAGTTLNEMLSLTVVGSSYLPNGSLIENGIRTVARALVYSVADMYLYSGFVGGDTTMATTVSLTEDVVDGDTVIGCTFGDSAISIQPVAPDSNGKYLDPTTARYQQLQVTLKFDLQTDHYRRTYNQ